MPAVARQLASDLLAQGWAEVTVDPYEWNERAIRGWEKAGFVEVSRGHAPDERCTRGVGARCGSPARLSAMLLRLTTTLTLCRVRATVAGPHAG